MERRVECLFPFDPSDPSRRVLFAGPADRIDALDDGPLRVVDYKFGEVQAARYRTQIGSYMLLLRQMGYTDAVSYTHLDVYKRQA